MKYPLAAAFALILSVPASADQTKAPTVSTQASLLIGTLGTTSTASVATVLTLATVATVESTGDTK